LYPVLDEPFPWQADWNSLTAPVKNLASVVCPGLQWIMDAHMSTHFVEVQFEVSD